MSVQFGRWSFGGTPFALDWERVDSRLAPYGPDGKRIYKDQHVIILFRAFHTTKESLEEIQPFRTSSALIITWDGRLDNRLELIAALEEGVPRESPDVHIISRAFERWGIRALGMFLGDWCLSIWDTRTQTLLLAKDPIGVRTLFYSVEPQQITWSTILDPLVLLAGRQLTLCEEYVAGSYFLFPSAQLTPFSEILSVPAACFVELTKGTHRVQQYWRFEPKTQIRYRSDAEYEEHFRVVLRKAVKRRLRSHSPVLAELSGGMDSSTIVCVADQLIAEGVAEAPRLDTVSYYDDSEPNWNEKPYFSAIERLRGRVGSHIDISQRGTLLARYSPEGFAPTPFSLGARDDQQRQRLRECIESRTNRVLLSGFGGDEVLGGSPDPLPELRNLLVALRLPRFAHELKLWAIAKRKPWLHLVFECLRGFFPFWMQKKRSVPWLERSFVERNSKAVAGYPLTIKLGGPSPALQENIATIHALRRQLAATPLERDPICELRYPLLDRELLEFLSALPREQLVRPGERRSLMRRSLTGIVPPEILARRRKAFVARAPILAIAAAGPELLHMATDLVSSALGFVNPKRFTDALEMACRGRETLTVSIARTVAIELWLRTMASSRILALEPGSTRRGRRFGPKIRSLRELNLGGIEKS